MTTRSKQSRTLVPTPLEETPTTDFACQALGRKARQSLGEERVDCLKKQFVISTPSHLYSNIRMLAHRTQTYTMAISLTPIVSDLGETGLRAPALPHLTLSILAHLIPRIRRSIPVLRSLQGAPEGDLGVARASGSALHGAGVFRDALGKGGSKRSLERWGCWDRRRRQGQRK
ncbi:hypothetical protein BDV93DRAFT_564999 [Ceratobasidium sp. AG-I]|nr:hypothetical protein BDV93DRAFT_564999 [Ceratobasidium sp. AG-I]